MGIPLYFSTIIKKYDNIISKQKPLNIDYYFLDFNGVIHPVCKNMLDTKTFTEDGLIKKLHTKVKNDTIEFKAKKTFICVDGSVPMAKIIQQRKRRYLAVYRNKIDDVKPQWDTNAITPGTEFMKKLDTYFESNPQENVIYSGSNISGEGEHKIFQYLEKDDKICVINGLDADLIILSLLSNKKNIYLMREDVETTYVSIDKLRNAIICELTRKWEVNDSQNSIDIIESYCVMCSLMGNDFIPHLLTLNFKSNGYEKLITYTGNSIRKNGLLVSEGKINYNTLIGIFQELNTTEDQDIHRETEKYMKQCFNEETKPSEYYGFKNKALFTKEIYANLQKWRIIYYRMVFNTNILTNTTVVQQSCEQYLYGIYWTYHYYKKFEYDNTWFYPYQYPPTIKDIYNYTIGNKSPVMIDNKFEIPNSIQLMIVMPRESKELVNKRNRQFYENEQSSLYHLYPKEYSIQTYLKKHLWECEPILPIINLKYISKYIK
jgi:5'-3' exonuclease